MKQNLFRFIPPTFETLAEYKMVKALVLIGWNVNCSRSDCSTSHEYGMLLVSVITDMGDEENIEEVNHEEVLQASQKAEPHVET